MRLDKSQQKALQNAIKNVTGEVYLFGSRTDDTKKGGDIDILVFSDKNPLKLSLQIQSDYFKECEEDIDVVVYDPNKLNSAQQDFYNSINKIRLK